MKNGIKKTIVFQGDSITDWHRDRSDPNDLGMGYPPAVRHHFAGRELRFLNRGVSGDRVCHLRARWTEDCMALQPDILCIFAGVNDVLVQLYENFMTPHDEFMRDYRLILDEVKTKLPQTKIIMVQPFMLAATDEIRGCMPFLEPIKDLVEKLSKEYADAYIPLSDMFCDIMDKERVRPAALAEDGVHPTAFGYYIITNAFIRTLENFI